MLFRIVLPTAFALSTDAFVVAIAKGVQARTRSPTAALRIGLLFGYMLGRIKGFDSEVSAATATLFLFTLTPFASLSGSRSHGSKLRNSHHELFANPSVTP